MKLKNKKTGEIKECVVIPIDDNGYPNEYQVFDKGESLAELNEEWEDYEEPKEYWRITDLGELKSIRLDQHHQNIEKCKEIGNYFETKEEAEKAVRKLKAAKRLEDKGFRPKMWEWEYIYDDNISGELIIKAHIDDATDSDGKYTKDLDLLFGGEE